MKKLISVILCVLLLFSLCACNSGKIDDVKMPFMESEIYSQEDISLAISAITEEFKKEWSGCTLTEIYYAGDDVSAEYQDWADRHNADEVIVLLSSFDVDSSGGDGSLNSNSTYNNWSWILVRTAGGEWKHVDHGY
jgi:hypothetical protein